MVRAYPSPVSTCQPLTLYLVNHPQNTFHNGLYIFFNQEEFSIYLQRCCNVRRLNQLLLDFFCLRNREEKPEKKVDTLFLFFLVNC